MTLGLQDNDLKDIDIQNIPTNKCFSDKIDNYAVCKLIDDTVHREILSDKKSWTQTHLIRHYKWFDQYLKDASTVNSKMSLYPPLLVCLKIFKNK